MKKIDEKSQLKMCVNCSYINDPKSIKCKQCGNNLFTEPSDPVQVAKSEGHFLGAMAAGKYERVWYRVILAIFIGLALLIPALLIGYAIFVDLMLTQEISLLWGIIAVLGISVDLFFGIVGLLIIFRAIVKIFLISKNK